MNVANGFLSPSGIFYACTPFAHLSTAESLCMQFYLSYFENKPNNRLEKEEFLYKHGWVGLRAYDVLNLIGTYEGEKHERIYLTPMQIEWFNDHYAEFSQETQTEIERMFKHNRRGTSTDKKYQDLFD